MPLSEQDRRRLDQIEHALERIDLAYLSRVMVLRKPGTQVGRRR